MFQKIAEHSYLFPFQQRTDRPNIGYVRGNNASLLFEAGNSKAHADLIRSALADANLPAPAYVAVSHWHWDHTFAMHAWKAIRIAGAETNTELERMKAYSWSDEDLDRRIKEGEEIVFCAEMLKREYPDRSKIHVISADLIFEEHLRIELGGVSCELIHARGPHSRDSVICYVPEDRLVFLGDSDEKDFYGEDWVFDPEHDELLGEAIAQMPYREEYLLPYVELLSSLDFTHCVSGHAPIMTRDDLSEKLGVSV